MKKPLRNSISYVLAVTAILALPDANVSASADSSSNGSRSRIVLEHDFAKNFIQFGLCGVDFHSKSLPCQHLDQNGFWSTMRFSWKDYKYVEDRKDNSSITSAMDVVLLKAKNGINFSVECKAGAGKFDVAWKDMCPYLDTIYQLYFEIRSRKGDLHSNITPDDLLTLIIVIGWITDVEQYSGMMAGDGKFSYENLSPWDSREDIAKKILCSIRSDICNERSAMILSGSPAFEMLRIYYNSSMGNKAIFDGDVLETGVELNKLRIGWSSLEEFSLEYGHIQNARLASSLTQASMRRLETYIGKREK